MLHKPIRSKFHPAGFGLSTIALQPNQGLHIPITCLATVRYFFVSSGATTPPSVPREEMGRYGRLGAIFC